MTMRQLSNRMNAEAKRDTKRGPRKIPSSPDGAARALAGTCRYCGGPLWADGEGGWTCPRRDSHSGGPDRTVEYANAYRSLRRFLWNRFDNCVLSSEQREFVWSLLTNFPEPK